MISMILIYLDLFYGLVQFILENVPCNNEKNASGMSRQERRGHIAKVKKMEQVSEMKVKEKFQKLKDSEAEFQWYHRQMKNTLEAQHKQLQEKHHQFEDEKANWELNNMFQNRTL